jgi:hypothetical protein
MTLYEFATCASNDELYRWWSEDNSTIEQCKLGHLTRLSFHDDDEVKRMHMLFVWWATQ